MDGLFVQVWNVLVCLDMAGQVVTGNNFCKGAVQNNFTNCKDFNHEQRKSLWIQTYFDLARKCEQISFRINPHLFPGNYEHECKKKINKKVQKGSCFADIALFNLFVLNVLGN